MKIDESKLARQKQIVQKWIDNKGRGVATAVTGFGKTFISILIIQEMNRRNSKCTTHVVVPTTNLKNDWTGKEGHIAKHKLQNVEVFVVNSYVKEKRSCSLLVMDECHVYSNESANLFKRVISETTYTYVLGLSATLESHHLVYLNQYKIPVIDNVSFEEARANKWISEYKILNVSLPMNRRDEEAYKEMSSQFNKLFAVFKHDFNFAMACMANKEARVRYAEEIGWDENRVYLSALNWNRNMQKRKSFLYGTDTKIDYAMEVLEMTNMKTIVFSESVDFIDRFSNRLTIPHVVYHSKMGVRAKREALKKFESGEVRVILSAKALDVGFNVEGIECAIVCSRTSKSLQSTQRLGRAVRFVEGKTAYFINLYVPGTQDETWLKKSLKGQKNCLWVNQEQIKEYFYGSQNESDSVRTETENGRTSFGPNSNPNPNLQYRFY